MILKVGFAAALAALLVRFRPFRNLLFTEIRDSDQKVMLLLFLTPPLAIGVVLRLVGGYRFFDLTLEGSFLMGLIGGRIVGLLGGSLISLPAFGNHEWLSSPLAALVGLIAGTVREVMPEKEDIWHFGPFLFVNIPQWIWRYFRFRKGNWAMLPLFTCVALTVGQIELADAVPRHWLFSWHPTNWGYSLLVVMSSMMSVAMAIKIWNNTRIEMNLAQNQQLLLKARMDALTSQINPHFLFNTLNTVSSLIRFDPDMARGVVLKLSNILRRLLRKHETFVPLREELAFIDDYLDIEVIRFGRDKLQIFKDIDEDSLETFVPSMLLQPMVENSIKHGLGAAPRRRTDSSPRAQCEWPPADRNRRQRYGHFAGAPGRGLWRRNRHHQRARTPASSLRRPVQDEYPQQGRRRHPDPHRNPRTGHRRAFRHLSLASRKFNSNRRAARG